MTVSDFDFKLPPELLAEYPTDKRDGSKLMVINRKTGEIKHSHFYNITEYLNENDLLVRNNTKVKAVSFLARKETLKGALLKVLLIKQLTNTVYEAYIDPLKKVKKNSIIVFGEGQLKARLIKIVDQRFVHLEFIEPENAINQQSLLLELGQMPIPPYLRRKPEALDLDRYQTVFAEEENALAAPTSALHFTNEIFNQLKKKGTKICDLTLEIGLGTFNPVYGEVIESHDMHNEKYTISEETALEINNHKKENKRVVALGTTSIRATESAYKNGELQSGSKSTNIFIHPPYEFKIADALITNFHTPRSTLLMLVSAFGGYDLIMKAYKEAIENKYRFYSYGDSMLII